MCVVNCPGMPQKDQGMTQRDPHERRATCSKVGKVTFHARESLRSTVLNNSSSIGNFSPYIFKKGANCQRALSRHTAEHSSGRIV